MSRSVPCKTHAESCPRPDGASFFRFMTSDPRHVERRTHKIVVPVDRRNGDRRTGDRRRAARAPLDLWVEEEKGNELYFRRTGNVSLGGIYFEQTIPHALGTTVRLRFSLPGSEAL